MELILEYLDRMLPDGAKYAAPVEPYAPLSHSKILKLAESDPLGAIRHLFGRHSRTIVEFKEVFARVKRIHAARFADIIDQSTYQICGNHEYYIICSGWIRDIKAGLKGAIDHSNKETVRRILREYPEYASMAIKRAFRMLELDIGELACRHDATFAVGFEIERGVCKCITKQNSSCANSMGMLYEELCNLHVAPQRAGCLPIRYAALLNNDRTINTLISHEINTKGSHVQDINMELVNTAIAACALFNSVESLWVMLTYYYSHALDGLATRAINGRSSGNNLYHLMNAKSNTSIQARTLSAKYAQISVASLRPEALIAKLLHDITILDNYESWVILFYYLIDNDDTFLKLPTLMAPIVPVMSQSMLRVFGDLIPEGALRALPTDFKRALLGRCLSVGAVGFVPQLIEWDNEMLNIAAYYNSNIVPQLISIYASDRALTKSVVEIDETCRGINDNNKMGADNTTQMARLCLSERGKRTQGIVNTTSPRAKGKLNATLAVACYVVKANYGCAIQILANDYCFYVDKSNAKLKSAIAEYGNDEVIALFVL